MVWDLLRVEVEEEAEVPLRVEVVEVVLMVQEVPRRTARVGIALSLLFPLWVEVEEDASWQQKSLDGVVAAVDQKQAVGIVVEVVGTVVVAVDQKQAVGNAVEVVDQRQVVGIVVAAVDQE